MPIEIRRKDLKTLVDRGRAQLIDVLPLSEYKKQHLPRALNIPLENMNAKITTCDGELLGTVRVAKNKPKAHEAA